MLTTLKTRSRFRYFQHFLHTHRVATKILLESLFFILPRDVAVFTKNLRMEKIYLIKWQHRIQYFVQLSLFLTIVNVTVNLKV
jgi:hypothetical protein